MGLDLRFLTKNDHKFEEFRQLFVGTAYTIAKALSSIEEIQTEDMEALVADKVIRAFDKIRRPVFVDHTGLQLESLDGFPGGLTEIFWERLKNERLAQLFGNSPVTAVTLIGYCDGNHQNVPRRGEGNDRSGTARAGRVPMGSGLYPRRTF
jgi:XTP/dITP diphosphohydrolase